MARIKCRTPATGKTLRVILEDVSTDFTTIVEAPDFSVPDTANLYPDRDPTDTNRAIRPGEVFFLTPLAAKNKTASTAWIETIFVTETGETIEFAKIDVPAGDTIFIPLQGRSLLKRDPDGANGDIVQVRAESTQTFDIWVSAEEKTSSEHLGVE
jgi:hypothetical protein